MNDPDLEALAEPLPAPRRSDAAFARDVAGAMAARRRRRWLVAPLAMAAAVTALVLFLPRAPADAELFDDDDDDGLFAIPALDGSTDEELALLERALDRALAQQPTTR
jgi:hypothetical protein